MTAETAAVLHRAADLLEERGWCQHTTRDDTDGRICAVTAVSDAALEFSADPREAVAAVVRHVCAPGDSRVRGALARWNDAPGRSRREVTDALRGAAADAP